MNDKDAVVFGTGLRMSSSELYEVYTHWCDQNALTPLKRETFISWLKANQSKYGISYDYNIVNRENRRVRGFTGIYASNIV